MLQTEQNEVNILSSYLPKLLSDEETKKICQETLNTLGATEIKDLGKVMGELKKKYADKNFFFTKFLVAYLNSVALASNFPNQIIIVLGSKPKRIRP